jgi:hypothetical protein
MNRTAEAPGEVSVLPAEAEVAVRVFRGLLAQGREARRWVRAQVPPGDPGADDTELAAGELFANAVLHTRSGGPDGTVTVIIAPDGTLHVHDLGTTGPCPARDGWPQGREGFGRGLVLAAALGTGLMHVPAAACPAAATAAPGGCCTTWRPAAQALGRETGQPAAAAAA